jgi:hypothetical protein
MEYQSLASGIFHIVSKNGSNYSQSTMMLLKKNVEMFYHQRLGCQTYKVLFLQDKAI